MNSAIKIPKLETGGIINTSSTERLATIGDNNDHRLPNKYRRYQIHMCKLIKKALKKADI